MSEMFPIIPDLDIPDIIVKLIQEHCPLSTIEIVDEGDTEHKIYKFVGFIDQQKLTQYIPGRYIKKYFRRNVVSLYEGYNDQVCVFWHDNVLVVMISNTEDQHEGVMTHYEDAAALLTQIDCGDILRQIRSKTKEPKDGCSRNICQSGDD